MSGEKELEKSVEYYKKHRDLGGGYLCRSDDHLYHYFSQYL